MTHGNTNDLGKAMLALVPVDGRTIGNKALREQLVVRIDRQVDEAEFFTTQQALVDAGALVRGRGRGGAVKRAQAASDGALNLEMQEVPASTQEPQSGKKRKSGNSRRQQRSSDVGGEAVLAYRHDETRTNNPQVGMVAPENDPAVPPTTWAWDPHIDPALQFDVGRRDIEKLIDDALASDDQAAMRDALLQLKRQAGPYLNWTGKAEGTSFEVDTVSLHVHERIDPATVLAALRKQLKNGRVGEDAVPYQHDMFRAWFDRPLPLREAIEFYQHDRGWANRLIAGDSLLVMNSLIEKESMAGQVQMIYIDPPYGIKYGSNFQPFVNKRDVKDRKDEDLTAEPEMIKAFRDTWQLGIHSYLTYLRDRLLLARELLSESGSVFVQISDENLHHVRELCDEIFGEGNLVGMITYSKTTSTTSELLGGVADYIVWYAKDRDTVKYRQLYLDKKLGGAGGSKYTSVRLPSGADCLRSKLDDLPVGARIFRRDTVTSQRPPGDFPVSFRGRDFSPRPNYWKTGDDGFTRLIHGNRLLVEGRRLAYVRFIDDFPVFPITNVWTDLGGVQSRSDPKVYVVQTATSAVERCLLMTTDPGDLVLDPTCGSGTTAFVAEKWGRRWISCDTSRVAVTLAKQRLMTANYDYYDLKYPHEGLKSGFIYKTVPHVTLKSIANNPEIDEIHERMQPAIDAALADLNTVLQKTKVPLLEITVGGRKGETVDFSAAGQTHTLASGETAAADALLEWEVPFECPDDWQKSARKPFDAFYAARQAMQNKMDAAIAAHAPEEILYDRPQVNRDKLRITGPFTVEAVPFATVLSLDEADKPKDADTAIARSGESARQHGWRDELLKTGIRGQNKQILAFAELETLPGTHYLHCSGTLADSGDRVVVSFGPEHAALEQRQVEFAIREAGELFPRPQMIVFAAFAFDPEAAKDIDATQGIVALKAQMNTDLLTEDLKKKQRSNQSFWLMGQPEVDVRRLDDGQYEVEVNGFDYFDTRSGELESGGKKKIAMWLLDTDYDERSLYPRQVFFPMAGKKDGWNKLKKAIRAELDDSRLQQLHGTVSLPFTAGDNQRVAVKIVDDRGIESLKVMPLSGVPA